MHTKLPDAVLEKMVEGASILEQDSYGPKVYRLVSGDILKLFRRKRLFSSAALRPHSQRFCRNAKALRARGIPTITPLKLYRLDDTTWTAVLYRPLPGETLSHLLRDSPARWPELLPRLARFINQLHEQGVYFRSLHPGNIVLTESGELGLIDIADMRIRRHPLSDTLIRRNREHFEKYVRKEQLALDTGQIWQSCDDLKARR